MLKKLLNTTIAALLTAALVTPCLIFADDLGDIGADQTDVHVEADDTATSNAGQVSSNEGSIQTNTGTVTDNTGSIGTNEGTVTYNGTTEDTTATIDLNAATGTVTENNGEITNNNGTVDTNKGTIGSNEGVIDQETGAVEGGVVKDNQGDIDKNKEHGTVEENSGEINQNDGSIVTNESSGTVKTNNGSVSQNDGIVEENTSTGTVAENNGMGVSIAEDDAISGNGIAVNNGEVTENNGDIVKNASGGTIEENNGKVDENAGHVDNNNEHATITLNSGKSLEYDSEHDTWVGDGVIFNAGTIANNVGDVVENSHLGTITLNSEGGEVLINRGTVAENDGTVANNFGTINNTADGKVTNNYGDASVTSGTIENQWWEVWANAGNDENGNQVSNFLKASIGGFVSKIIGQDDDENDISVDYIKESENSKIIITPDDGYVVVGLSVGKDTNGNDVCAEPVFDSRNNTWTISGITGNVSMLYSTQVITEAPEGWETDTSGRHVSYVVTDEGIEGQGNTKNLDENATVNGGNTLCLGTDDNHKSVMIEDPENPGSYIACPTVTYGTYEAKTNTWKSKVDATLPKVNGYAWTYDGVDVDTGSLIFSLVKVKQKENKPVINTDTNSDDSDSPTGNSQAGQDSSLSINAGVSATGMVYTMPLSAPTSTILGGVVALTNEQKAAAVASMSQGTFLISTGTDSEGVQTMIPSADQMKDQQGSAVTLLGQTARVEYCVSFSQPYSTIGNTAWLREKHEVILKLNGLKVGSTVYLMFTDAFGKVQLVPCTVYEDGVVIANLSNIGSGGILSVVSI